MFSYDILEFFFVQDFSIAFKSSFRFLLRFQIENRVNEQMIEWVFHFVNYFVKYKFIDDFCCRKWQINDDFKILIIFCHDVLK